VECERVSVSGHGHHFEFSSLVFGHGQSVSREEERESRTKQSRDDHEKDSSVQNVPLSTARTERLLEARMYVMSTSGQQHSSFILTQ
jgi:hypothetical protein